MPRVSFVGYLSGIMWVFVVLGFLPLAILTSQILIPLFILGHLYFVQKIILIHVTNEESEFLEEGLSLVDPPTSTKNYLRTEQFLFYQRNFLALTSLLPILSF